MKAFLSLMFLISTMCTVATADENKSRPMIKFIGKVAFHKWVGSEMAYSTLEGKVGTVFVNCKYGLNPFNAKIYLQIGSKSVESISEQKCITDLRKIAAANLNSPVTVYIDNFEIE